MCDGIIRIRGLEGRYRVEVVPRSHILKDVEIVLHDHPQGVYEGGGTQRLSGWGADLDVPMIPILERAPLRVAITCPRPPSSLWDASSSVGPVQTYGRGEEPTAVPHSKPRSPDPGVVMGRK